MKDLIVDYPRVKKSFFRKYPKLKEKYVALYGINDIEAEALFTDFLSKFERVKVNTPMHNKHHIDYDVLFLLIAGQPDIEYELEQTFIGYHMELSVAFGSDRLCRLSEMNENMVISLYKKCVEELLLEELYRVTNKDRLNRVNKERKMRVRELSKKLQKVSMQRPALFSFNCIFFPENKSCNITYEHFYF